MTTWLTTPSHARWLEHQTTSLLAFARPSPLPAGGFGYLDANGALVTARGAELWISCRMTHCFAMAAMMGHPGYAPLADHGVRSLLDGPFADKQNGGWYSAITADGAPASDTKEAYAHGFVILAAASAAAANRPNARELLDKALQTNLAHFWNEQDGMVADACSQDFATTDPYRGVNSNMHTLEAYLAAADVTQDPAWLHRGLRISTRVVHENARSNNWRIPEHYDESWSPLLEYNDDNKADKFRPYGATPGHGLEWSRLILHLHAALHAIDPANAPDWIIPAAKSLYARAIEDGWAPGGTPGFAYTVGWDGTPVTTQRLHWVAAEAIGAAAALHHATQDPIYATDYQKWWDYVAEFVIDHEKGSWHHETDPDGRPDITIWPGKPDVYHAVQATLIPRLPLAPAMAPALAAGLLDVR